MGDLNCRGVCVLGESGRKIKATTVKDECCSYTRHGFVLLVHTLS